MTSPRMTPDFPALASALEQSFNAIMLTDAEPGPLGPRILYVNAAFCRMSGYEEHELLGRTPRILQGPETNQDVLDRLRQNLKEGSFFQGSTVNYRKDGTPFSVEWNVSPVRDADGRIVQFLSVHQDVSTLVAEQRTNQLFSSVLNNMADGVFVTNGDGLIEYANSSLEAITGYSATELLGKPPRTFRSEQHGDDFYQGMWAILDRGETFRATFANRRKDGQMVYCDEAISAVTDANAEVTHYMSVMRDQTQRIKEVHTLRQMAWIDGLTGAMTRAAGNLQLEKSYMQAISMQSPMTIALVDVDLFKVINDTWGHAAGDKALKEVARQLRAGLRNSDSVIRWGGDEFLVVFNGCEAKVAFGLAERCRETVQKRTAESLDFTLSLSIGVEQLRPGETLEGLFERVDRSLYQAKCEGRNRVCSEALGTTASIPMPPSA